MEKNLYETYEFLPSTGADAEADEFFVVQNDGTLLINRQVQYVAEVENVKGVLENVQPCTAVYDVTSQQYYVDVDNSAGLISVSDQFVLPHDASNNQFGNNYLLQSIPAISEPSVQIAETVSVANEFSDFAMKEEPINPSTIEGPETTNFTEITLNDEQYRMLEAKGWVLLEMGGKAYLLNTLGLHDITDNEKLLKDLRNDLEVIEPTSTVTVLHDTARNGGNSYELEEIMTTIVTKSEQAQLMLSPKDVDIQYVRSAPASQGTLEPSNAAPVTGNAEQTPAALSCTNADGTKTEPAKTKPSMIVRLQTNLTAEDIPNKIVLGKTANGKRLVAKVRSIRRPTKNEEVCSENNPQDPDDSRKKDKEAYYKAKEVETLIQKHMASPDALTSTAKDVKSAEMIIKQLLNVPATRTPMIQRNLIITKIVKTMKDAETLLCESEPTLVTGRVAQFREKGEWHFIYVPHLLQKLQKNCSDEPDTSPGEGAPGKTLDDYLLHVHVLEIKCPKALTRTSITFSKKRIQFQAQQLPTASVLTNKAIFACRACAKVFANEQELTEHQVLECQLTDSMDVEDEKPPLIIDTDKFSKLPISLKKSTQDPAKKGSCPYCNTKGKITNLRRHLQSHIGPIVKGASPRKANEDETNKGKSSDHVCKMCATPYYHAITLSKHILTQHIQSNVCML